MLVRFHKQFALKTVLIVFAFILCPLSAISQSEEMTAPSNLTEADRATAQLVESPHTQLGYLKKLVVFPISIQGRDKLATEIWQKVREGLSDSKRFVVAGEKFLSQRNAFRPFTQLNPSEAISQGKSLEADALVTLNYSHYELTMTAFSSLSGEVLWGRSIKISQSSLFDQDLIEATIKLTLDFNSSVPYQGLQIFDPLIGKSVFEDNANQFVKIDIGENTRPAIGDIVQWIELEKTSNLPLFLGGSRIHIVADGEITKNENGILTVELKHLKDMQSFVTGALIRLPKEAEYLTRYSIKQDALPEIKTLPMNAAHPTNEATKPWVTIIAGVANLAAFLLLL